MSVTNRGHLLQKVTVAGKQLEIRIEFDPLSMCGVIAALELERANQITSVIVEIACDRLHPCIISIARIIYIALVNLNKPFMSLNAHQILPVVGSITSRPFLKKLFSCCSSAPAVTSIRFLLSYFTLCDKASSANSLDRVFVITSPGSLIPFML